MLNQPLTPIFKFKLYFLITPNIPILGYWV